MIDVIQPYSWKLCGTLVVPVILALSGCSTTPAPTQQQQQPPPSERAATTPRQEEPQAQPGSGGGRHRKRHRKHGGGGNPDGPANPQQRNTTGNFDFYLLSLSWSPGFCATPAGQRDPGQCAPGRKFAFVLHGLWPQYEGTGWPEDCSTEQIDPNAVNKMISIMPSAHLIEHEWSKHGTCSGLTSAEYFEEATEAYRSIKVPAEYQELASMLTVDPAEVRSKFAAANPSLGEQGIVVECSGRYLSEVHACLTKDLAGRPCNREELGHECRQPQVTMRPVR
jgi:ribonuclease T2